MYTPCIDIYNLTHTNIHNTFWKRIFFLTNARFICCLTLTIKRSHCRISLRLPSGLCRTCGIGRHNQRLWMRASLRYCGEISDLLSLRWDKRHTHTCAHANTHTHTHTHTHAHTRAHTHACTRMHTHAHTRTYRHRHTHTHTYAHTLTFRMSDVSRR